MSANCLALFGTGFSKNWNGRLAREITADLQSRLQNDTYLLNLLNTKNFEDALSTVQSAYTASPTDLNKQRLCDMQQVLIDVFEAMNSNFEAKGTLDFSNEVLVRSFLVKFDGIFTLNQDLLIELNYPNLHEDAVLWHANKWKGWCLPGLQSRYNSSAPNKRNRSTWVPKEPFVIDASMQPYFKLHGSIAWQTTEGLPLLVIGRDKVSTIRQHPILQWSFGKFEEFLARPNTRLMVIGYGFGDDHINQAIVSAHQNGSLRLMYLVHPSGRDVLEKYPGAAIRVPQPLQDIPSIECRAPLSVTFSYDEAERRTLLQIFRD
jgi:hypothetical protein